MRTILKRWTGRNEFWVAVTIVLTCAAIGSVNPAFWSLMNLCDLLRSTTVTSLFALGGISRHMTCSLNIHFMGSFRKCQANSGSIF